MQSHETLVLLFKSLSRYISTTSPLHGKPGLFKDGKLDWHFPNTTRRRRIIESDTVASRSKHGSIQVCSSLIQFGESASWIYDLQVLAWTQKLISEIPGQIHHVGLLLFYQNRSHMLNGHYIPKLKLRSKFIWSHHPPSRFVQNHGLCNKLLTLDFPITVTSRAFSHWARCRARSMWVSQTKGWPK